MLGGIRVLLGECQGALWSDVGGGVKGGALEELAPTTTEERIELDLPTNGD